ncbi:hypothetical protein Poli38472_004249 [Pythium oligandrum]|uniref:Folate receptor-like domain-containing protein n=1 Tax=Pythium oligandrum TaxID=41045 RepID=A0A8K1CNR9_PYTOL|nr:hypothetical protein Poli38472_004249 [Pythium oligandrum]|eukprot:TMW66484.1 hypothetical protein Poli38472_004249 [Pythium oligandrum]
MMRGLVGGKRALLTALWALVLLLVEQDGALCAAEPRQAETGTCRSVGGLRFDPAERSMQRSKGLELCSQYRGNTCCNATHMMRLRLKLREPVVAQFNRRCQKLTDEMTCSPCHPFVGTGKIKTVCPRLCDDWFNACRSEYYSFSGSGSLVPCYGNALVCSPLSIIAPDGAGFCSKMGFQVGSEDDSEGHDCFDGSVPRQLGEAEPQEPWQTWLQRLFEEQSDDPSGLFIVALFVPLFFAYRLFKQLRGPAPVDRYGRSLTLEEVRAMQQASYERAFNAAGDDSDSSSSVFDQDEIDERREIEQEEEDKKKEN